LRRKNILRLNGGTKNPSSLTYKGEQMTSQNVLDFVGKIRTQLRCKRNLIVLSGDIGGLYPTGSQEYLTLEPTLSHSFENDFNIITYDLNGVDFASDGALEETAEHTDTRKVAKKADSFLKHLAMFSPRHEDRDDAHVVRMVEKVSEVDFQPLQSLQLLREIMREIDGKKAKPLCVIVRDGGLVFPRKPDGDLTAEHAQRLQLFLNWMRSEDFNNGNHVVILLTTAVADLKETILQLPNCGQVEIPLPTAMERSQFIENFVQRHKEHDFGMTVPDVVTSTPGLQLSVLSDVMETSVGLNQPLKKDDLKTAVNTQLARLLGDFGTVEYFPFSPEDVIGNNDLKEVVTEIFTDCEDPDLCPHMLLFVGPNGGGKTFFAKAYLKASGRIVIVLSKIRDSLYGGTERLFERFRMVVEAFGNIAVFVDEADTFFGKLGSSQSHEVDNRLTGSIQDMTSDPRFRYKVLWVLATARPDNLAPDILSRCASTTIPVFDLEGEERKTYLRELFARKGIDLGEEELVELHKKTEGFSNRDLDNLLIQVKSRRRKDSTVKIMDVLSKRRPGLSTITSRLFQEIEAGRVSSFPDLTPRRINEYLEEKVPASDSDKTKPS